MAKHRLPTPMLHVVMRDDSEFDVQCLNVDLVAWDRDAWKHKWPGAQDAPFMWMEYLAWHALTKTHGLLPSMTLREFGDRVATITSQADDDDTAEAEGVDPTREDHEVD